METTENPCCYCGTGDLDDPDGPWFCSPTCAHDYQVEMTDPRV